MYRKRAKLHVVSGILNFADPLFLFALSSQQRRLFGRVGLVEAIDDVACTLGEEIVTIPKGVKADSFLINRYSMLQKAGSQITSYKDVIEKAPHSPLQHYSTLSQIKSLVCLVIMQSQICFEFHGFSACQALLSSPG